jgi:hypothetical protein
MPSTYANGEGRNPEPTQTAAPEWPKGVAYLH